MRREGKNRRCIISVNNLTEQRKNFAQKIETH